MEAGIKQKTMNFNTHAPWEHYPKTLSHSETANPLKVVADFFVAGSVKGHKSKLKEWRYYVTNDQHYNDEMHGPGDLVFTYGLNLKLLDALYLLWLNHQNDSWNFKAASDTQLAEEKENWAYYPKNLKLKEQANPYRAIKKVFGKISPQQYREYLHEWLYFALYNTPADEDLTAGEILSVYEKLLKLYSAAWLIYQRAGSDPVITTVKAEKTKALPPIEIKAVWPHPTVAETLGLEELKKLILERFPVVKLIIHLGTHPNPYTFYLLILVDDYYKTPEHSISNKIEDNCKYLGNVLTLVHKESSAKTALKYGSRFWNNVIKQGHIIYQSTGLSVSPNLLISEQDIKDSPKYNWERWGHQGKDFLKGALAYQRDQKYRLAAFLLHQSVESILKAIIQAVLGYHISIHNIGRMLKITLLFTEAINDVFELNTTGGLQLFVMLQNAYAEARYKDEFNPDEDAIKLAASRVNSLYHVAEQVYKLVELE
jgi:HEPN domain-containing protein